jgi:hypothetical protein
LASANLKITHRLRAARLQNMTGKAGKASHSGGRWAHSFSECRDSSVYLPSAFSISQEFRPLGHSVNPCTKAAPLHRGCEYIERRRPFPTQANWHPHCPYCKKGGALYRVQGTLCITTRRPLLSVNGMVRPCSCPASDRSWQGAPKTRSTPCLGTQTPRSR